MAIYSLAMLSFRANDSKIAMREMWTGGRHCIVLPLMGTKMFAQRFWIIRDSRQWMHKMFVGKLPASWLTQTRELLSFLWFGIEFCPHCYLASLRCVCYCLVRNSSTWKSYSHALRSFGYRI